MAMVMILTWILFVISGLIMWFGKGIVSADLFRWMVMVHDLTMIAAVCMFLVHLYLAVAHPLMWAALVSMRFGVTSATYAAEHHAKWYYGPKRAKELYEAEEKNDFRRRISREERACLRFLLSMTIPISSRLPGRFYSPRIIEVLTAANGEKGLEVMRKEKPDLVLLDIMMSYILDGLDARRQMAADRGPQRHPGDHGHVADRRTGAE